MIKMSYNRCKDIHKFGNKYLPLAYKTQVEFRSHFSGKKCVVWSEKYSNCDSDHFLVQIKIKQKLITVKNRQTQKYKWDTQLLCQNEEINKYQEHLQSILQEINEETDINQDWQNLKQVIVEAVSEFKSNKGAWNAIHW